jgi:hypothetical protein
MAVLQLDASEDAVESGCSMERLTRQRSAVIVLRYDSINMSIGSEVNRAPSASPCGRIANKGSACSVINAKLVGIAHD